MKRCTKLTSSLKPADLIRVVDQFEIFRQSKAAAYESGRNPYCRADSLRSGADPEADFVSDERAGDTRRSAARKQELDYPVGTARTPEKSPVRRVN